MKPTESALLALGPSSKYVPEKKRFGEEGSGVGQEKKKALDGAIRTTPALLPSYSDKGIKYFRICFRSQIEKRENPIKFL